MNLRILASVSSALTLQAFGQFQAPIDEKWVLTENKETFLQNLTPGTDDHFFFHALHQQNSGDRAGFLKTMESWRAKFIKSYDAPARYTQLSNRQTLLDYEAGVKGADKALSKILRVKKPTAIKSSAARQSLPSKITPDQISSDAFKKALNIKEPKRLVSFSTQLHLEKLVSENRKWAKQERDSLLRQVKRADLPHIEKLIVANFNEKRSLPLSNVACSGKLSHSQLVGLQKRVPQFLNDTHFVKLMVNSMRVEDKSAFLRDPELHLEWLEQLDGFTQTLPSSFNSLKAHVLYHLLRLSHETDKYPIDTLVRYMTIARPNLLIKAQMNKAVASRVNYRARYDHFTDCQPINQDKPLVDTYLDKLLNNSSNQQKLSKFYKNAPFEKLVSRAQLLVGASAGSLSTQLSATEYEALRDEKELTIASSTPTAWSADNKVSLNLDLKNIDELTVSIYALDSLRYMQKTGTEISKDLDLSSLVANTTRTVSTKQSPFLRHRNVLQLPELTGVGSWMVEVHGNGQRATALIHKGELHTSVRDTGSGQEIFVTDYSGEPLKDVLAVINGKKLLTNAEGVVRVPYSAFRKQASAYFHLYSKDRENGITRKADFLRLKATPKLDLSVFSHPEQWIADEKVTFYYKPSFRINDHPGSLKGLTNSTATLTATLEDGTKIQLANAQIKISANDYLPLSFNVPKNMTKLDLQIDAEMKPIAGRVDQHLKVSKSLPVTSAPKKENLAHSYFYNVGGNWVHQSLGRNGEI